MLRRGRIGLLAVALGLLGWVIAASGGTWAAPGAVLADGSGWTSAGGLELQRACAYSGQLVDSDSRTPVAGATVTVVETGFTTTTGTDGRYTITIPGPGTWTVRATAPGFSPLTTRLEIGPDCAIISRAAIDDEAEAVPAAQPPGAYRITGTLAIEGRPASARVTITALIGDRVCGTASTGADGHYTLDVASASASPGCGTGGAEVRFTVIPPFGSGWPAGASAFQPGGATTRDLAVDLRTLPPDAENVPWNSAFWPDPSAVPIGICARLSPAEDSAVQGAFRQWREAARTQGLRLNLVSDADAACADDRPGIAVIEGALDEPDAIAGTATLDADLKPCRRDVPCWAFKSVIVVDSHVFDRLTAAEQTNALAHEIGHALGLGHAARCDGGTIMWANTQCAYPLTSLGVDDIASLNNKVNAITGAAAASTDHRTESGAARDGAVASGALQGSLSARLGEPALLQAGAWDVLTNGSR